MKRKFMIMMLVAALSVAVRASASTWPEACGKDSVQFKVTTKKQAEPVAPEAGKALLVFSESSEWGVWFGSGCSVWSGRILGGCE